MLGLFYFIIIAIAGAVYYSQREESRKKSRDVAWQYGRNDYRDQYGRYWWNNTRCKIDIRDGHEVLVDWNNPEIVYWDYTWEKDKPRRNREEEKKKDEKKFKDFSISRYRGMYNIDYGYMCKEVVTGNLITVSHRSKNYLKKRTYTILKFPNDDYTYKELKQEDISYDEFRFLTGLIYNSCGNPDVEKDPTWRIQYIRDHGYEKYFNLEPLNQSPEAPNE